MSEHPGASHEQLATTTSVAVRDAIHDVVDGLAGELETIAVVMGGRVQAEIDDLHEGLSDETRLSCLGNVRLISEMLREDLEAASAVAPAEALHYAREYVRAGLPIEDLMRAYRIGHRVWWQMLLSELQRAPLKQDVLAEASLYCSQWLFAYVDTVTVQITEVFMHERERWVRSAAAVRSEEVGSILSGSQLDETRASQRLGYELRRGHVALLIWSDESDDGTTGLFERVAQECAESIGSGDVLSVPFGQRTLAAWIGLTDSGAAIERLGALPAPDLLEAGVRIAVGEPAPGLEGFRRSHADAQVARRVAKLRERRPGTVTRYPDAALLGLLAQEPAEAQRFALAELGALAGDSDSARRLSATLEVFLEEGSSHVRAARRLGVHENTIAYRVKRAEALLEHPLDERALELRAALLLTRTIGR